MIATYWVAKYVDDVLRNEPRNVGVIVRVNDCFAAKFLGERNDGEFDGRKVKSFTHPSVYSQWRSYWRRKVNAGNINAILEASTGNYFVKAGGEVSDIGSDSAADVCHFLYGMMVGKGLIDALEWSDNDAGFDLSSEITTALDNAAILARGDQLFARYPIQREQKILGRHVLHTPTFSQRNGKLYIMEYIDLGSSHINKTKERAGWMAYMFSDIKDADLTAQSFSLVRPSGDASGEQIEYAKAVLAGESIIVDWTDEASRSAFLAERRKIAEPALRS